MCTDSPSPDPAIGQASKDSIALAREQFEAQQRLLGEYSPLFKEQIGINLDQQRKNNARSDTQWDQYTQNFLPLEQKFAHDALNYDTPERRDKAAADARAGVAGTFETARQGLTESLQQQQLAGSSGKGLALMNAQRIAEARAKAGAGAAARSDVEKTGLSMVASGAQFGRNLPSTGISAGQAGAAGGSAATGNVSGLSGLTGAGYNQYLQGTGVGINGLLGQYQAAQQSSNAQNGIFGDLLGAGLTAYGMYKSSKKAKYRSSEGSKIGEGPQVDGRTALDGISSLPNESWTYKPGEGDGGSHIGPYAEDVQHRFGDSVAPGGEMIDMRKMSAVNRSAIAELAREIDGVYREIKQLEAA